MASGPEAAERHETAHAIALLLRGLFTARLSGRFFDGLDDLLGAPSPRPFVGIAIGAGAALLSMLLRFLATPYIGTGEALLTAFPAVLVAALTTGAWGGWTCLVLTTVGSWYLFIGERFTFSFGPSEPGILTGTFLAGAFVIQICRLMRGMFREIAALRATERLLSRELEHRIKNTLTLVLSISRQTFRSPRPMESALDDFEGRMVALAAAQDLAGGGVERKPAAIAAIARQSLAPFCGAALHDRLALSGAEAIVDVDTTVGLCLVFHELATNSAKYGALSVPDGRIAIDWNVAGNDKTLVMTWIELGGPAVEAPTREGFGSRLIERIVTRSLRGSMVVDYPRSGVRAVIRLPI